MLYAFPGSKFLRMEASRDSSVGWARRGRYFRNCVQAAGSCSKEARVSPSMALPIQTAARLVECPESLHTVRIEVKELLDEVLGNFGGRQVHLVEGAEQGQQIKPRRFQASAEVGRDFDESTRRHGPSMVHRERRSRMASAQPAQGDQGEGRA